MEKSEFEKLVREGIKKIPKKFKKKLNNVAIVIEDTPSAFQLRKLELPPGSNLFGLYEGIPQTKRGHYGMVLPDKITIFQKPIEKYANSPEAIRQIVKNTVWHEIAHHFGFNEREIRDLSVKKANRSRY